MNLYIKKATLWRKKKKLIILTAVICIILVVLFFIRNIQKNTNQVNYPTPSLQSYDLDTVQQSTFQSPQMYFASYTNKSHMPAFPNQVNSFTLKTDFSLADAVDLGEKLGLTEYKEPNAYDVILYNLSDPQNRGILTFKRKTGEFFFQSWGIHTADEGSATAETAARLFLDKLGVIDATVDCAISYRRRQIPDITYVECHRDWSRAGLPILNLVGVLNISENKPLSSLVLGEIEETAPDDGSIVDVSTGQDKKIRPNDFNTITVAIASDGRILSVQSNLRQIDKTQVISQNELITPDEAMRQFSEHKSQLALSLPAGIGIVDWDNVYVQNQGIADEVQISDFLLTYLEKPSSSKQDMLVPMYLIRGLAELSSGYTVRFIETVPALRSGVSIFVQNESTNTLYIPTGDSYDSPQKSIKLGAVTPQPTLTSKSYLKQPVQKTPLIVSPNPASGGMTFNPQCPDIFGEKEISFDVPGLGQLTVELKSATEGHTFYFKSASFPVTSMKEVQDIFFRLSGDQYEINLARWIIKYGEDRKNSNPLSINTIEDVYALFTKINGAYWQLGQQITACGEGNIVPPDIECKEGIDGIIKSYTYNKERIKSVNEYVAHKILEDIQQSKLSYIASQQEIFPKTTLDHFSWIFTQFEDSFISGANACYISGVSPSIYFSTDIPREVNLKLGFFSTYTDPATNESSWKVMVLSDSTIIQKDNPLLSRSHLYYEYDRNITFSGASDEGFIILKNQWDSFIRNDLSLRLALNVNETNALLSDIRHVLSELNDEKSPYLKISLIDQTELNKRLPIQLSPIPDKFYRIHVQLSPVEKLYDLVTPSLRPIVRSGFTVVEVGASGKE